MRPRWMILCAVLMALCLLPSFAMVPQAQEAPSRVIVSLGDSFSSGEGIEPFYGQDAPLTQKVKDQDWVAHRSEKSWPGLLKLDGVSGTMAEHRDENWYFVAASGAKTEHLSIPMEKEYKLGVATGTTSIDPQLAIFDTLCNKGVQAAYVTLTLGGNDAQFVEVIVAAATGGTDALSGKLDAVWEEFYAEGGIRDDLRASYEKIAAAAGEQAKILVAGYPKLLNQTKASTFFSTEAATLVNDSISKFNQEIAQLVESCRATGMNIYFVSVEEEFAGHEAYTEEAYINGVMIGAQSQDLRGFMLVSNYSVHPNALGAQAYARCVQRMIDSLEEDSQAAAVTQQASDAQKKTEEAKIPIWPFIAAGSVGLLTAVIIVMRKRNKAKQPSQP